MAAMFESIRKRVSSFNVFGGDFEDSQSDGHDPNIPDESRAASVASPTPSTSERGGTKSAIPLRDERIATLEKNLKDAKKILSNCHSRTKEWERLLRTERNGRDEDVRYWQKQADIQASDVQQLRAENENLQNHIQRLHTTLQQVEFEHQNLQKEHIAALTKLEHKESLYVSQTLELRTAQTFLGTADSVPGAEIIQAVRDLNSEIQNAAAMFSEEFSFASPASVDMDTDEQIQAQAEMAESSLLGEPLARALRTLNSSEDPSLVQLAVQALLASFSSQLILNWGGPRSIQPVLNELHGYIRRGEVQAISGRWRALAARYIRLNSDEPQNTDATRLIDHLAGLFVLSNCVKSRKEIRGAIASHFTPKLQTITSQALRLRTLLRENVTSTDYTVINVLPGTPFDPAVAEDEYSDDDADCPPQQPVLCTTYLGLRQVTKLQEHEKSANGSSDVAVLLLKPKVALENALEILLS